MRYLLDTNVVSDQTRPRPDPAVAMWISERQNRDMAVSAITFGEIQKGVLNLHPGAKRTFLTGWLEGLPKQFRGRVIPVTLPIARAWGRLADDARRAGRALTVTDGLLLATAAVHNLVLVTRDERDFRGMGVEILNPWGPR